jgi:hypothetical protein
VHEEEHIYLQPAPWYTYVTVQDGASTVLGASGTFSRLDFLKFRDGDDLPNWREIIAEGGDATTSFDAARLEVGNLSNGAVSLYWPIGGCLNQTIKERTFGGIGMQSPFFTDPVVAGVSLAAAQSIATKRFVKEVKSLITPFQGGVFLGELRQTLHMILHPAQALRRGIFGYFEKLKKISPRQTSKQLRRALGGTYLEAVFGWQPLMADIGDGFEALRRYSERRPFEIVKVTAKGRSEGQGSSLSSLYGHHYTGIEVRYRDYVSYSSWMKGGVLTKSDASGSGVRDLVGLNLREFVPTAWEVLPWSFFIDYFTNIGTVIDAWSSCNGKLAWVCSNSKTIKGRKILGISRVTDNSHCYTPAVIVIESQPKCGWRKVSVSRRRATNSWVPDFQFDLGLSGRQLLNTFFLAVQGGVRRPFF